jgi:hypothetical protein
MPCCKAEEFGDWCGKAEAPTVIHDGDEYCLFHLPASHKQKPTPDKFNKMVFSLIDRAKDRNALCDLSGSIFPGNVYFSQYNKDNPLPSIML